RERLSDEVSAVTVRGGRLRDVCLARLPRRKAGARAHGPAASARSAARAAAAVLEIERHVLFAVIDGDLCAGGDVFHGAKHHAAAGEHGFGVRVAGVIDVASDIAARGTVDGPAAVDLEQVLVGAATVERLRFLRVDAGSEILDDVGIPHDGRGGEEAEARRRAADAERLLRHRHHDLCARAGGASLTLGPEFARAFGATAAAARALAVRFADDVLEVVAAVVIGQFLARLDGAQRVDEHALALD